MSDWCTCHHEHPLGRREWDRRRGEFRGARVQACPSCACREWQPLDPPAVVRRRVLDLMAAVEDVSPHDAGSPKRSGRGARGRGGAW